MTMFEKFFEKATGYEPFRFQVEFAVKKTDFEH